MSATAREPLTESDENILKDILREIGLDRSMSEKLYRNVQLRQGNSLSPEQWRKKLDVIWGKLQNGRVTFTQG